jgi:hypothetical protein
MSPTPPWTNSTRPHNANRELHANSRDVSVQFNVC